MKIKYDDNDNFVDPWAHFTKDVAAERENIVKQLLDNCRLNA